MKHLVAAAVVISVGSVSMALAQEPVEPRDELRLDDGTHLVGELIGVGEEQTIIRTRFADRLTVDTATIVGFTTADPWTVELATGERFIGRLLYDADAQVQHVLDTPFGDVETEEPVVAVWPETEPDPLLQRQIEQVEQLQAEHDQQLMALRERHAEELPALDARWSARLELGLTGSTGNTDRIGFRGRARAMRETDFDRLTLHIGGQYAREGGEETVNEVFGGAGLEIDLTEDLFAFARAELERDEFEQLSLRATVTGGLGLFIIREEDQELKVRGGAGFQHESFRDGVTESDVVLELGVDYLVDIHPWLSLIHGTTVYPTVADPFGDFRLVSETAGEVPLGDGEDWSIRAGVRNRYNSTPRPGVRKLDTTYFLDLVFAWN